MITVALLEVEIIKVIIEKRATILLENYSE